MTAAELRRQFPRAPESFIARNATPEAEARPKRRSLAQMNMDAFDRLVKAGKLPPTPWEFHPPEHFEQFLPIPIISEANTREHWRKKAKRVQNQRRDVTLALSEYLTGCRTPKRVCLCRIAARRLDDDNLANAFKHVRDAIAAILGFDDRDPAVHWVYDQAKPDKDTPKPGFKVFIDWEAAPLCPHCRQALPRPAPIGSALHPASFPVFPTFDLPRCDGRRSTRSIPQSPAQS